MKRHHQLKLAPSRSIRIDLPASGPNTHGQTDKQKNTRKTAQSSSESASTSSTKKRQPSTHTTTTDSTLISSCPFSILLLFFDCTFLFLLFSQSPNQKKKKTSIHPQQHLVSSHPKITSLFQGLIASGYWGWTLLPLGSVQLILKTCNHLLYVCIFIQTQSS